jgi:hypothetical protein
LFFNQVLSKSYPSSPGSNSNDSSLTRPGTQSARTVVEYVRYPYSRRLSRISFTVWLLPPVPSGLCDAASAAATVARNKGEFGATVSATCKGSVSDAEASGPRKGPAFTPAGKGELPAAAFVTCKEVF